MKNTFSHVSYETAGRAAVKEAAMFDSVRKEIKPTATLGIRTFTLM